VTDSGEIERAAEAISGLPADDTAAAERLAERHSERVHQLRREACCPERAMRWAREWERRRAQGPPTPITPWEFALSKAITKAESSAGATLGLVGSQSTGKTCLAVALIREFTARDWSCRFATVTDVVASFIDARVSGRMRATQAEWLEPRLLVLDQFEKSGKADWEQRFVFSVLDDRHNQARVTVLIANPPVAFWTETQTAEIWGSSLQERMNEAGGVIECRWEGFRS
jgi:hypothetical protein